MSQLSKLSSSPTYAEASQIIPTLNYLIGLMNTAYGVSGSGSTSSAIYVPTVTSPVNLLSITPAATTGLVVLTVGGDSSDTNAGLLIAGKGTGPLSLGGAASASASMRVVNLTNSANYLQVTGATSATPLVALTVAGATSTAGLNISAAATGVVTVGGSTSANASLRVVTVASSVNWLQTSGGVTGSPPVLAAVGADTDVGLVIISQGAGVISVGGSTSANASLRVVNLTNSANFLQVSGATSASPNVTLSVGGATTTANLTLTAAATGTVQLGSSGSFSANASVATSITSLGCTNSRSNIQQWLRILDSTGASFFIPLF